MSRKKYSLTDEHRAQLKPWADKWIANALSTQGMTEKPTQNKSNLTINQRAMVLDFALRFPGTHGMPKQKTEDEVLDLARKIANF